MCDDKAAMEKGEVTTPAVEGWRPISEAPRDGTWFLAYWPVKSISDQICVTTYDDGRFMDAADHKDWCQPTHFMPLPTPPSEGVADAS